MKNSVKKLVLCAILAAMGVVILTLGVVIEALDLSAVMLASMLTVIAVVEAGRGRAFMTYGVITVLSILLLPSKLPGVMFLFMGYYPIVKEMVERLNKLLSWTLKLAVFNISLALLLLVMKLFVPGIELLPELKLGVVLTYAVIFALGNFVFVLYDILLTRLISLYFYKLRRRFGLGKN